MDTTKKYVLGDHSFDTIDEYWLAQHDIKKIAIITKQLDINDPEVASRLYELIRKGEITFDSPIGEEFTNQVTDVMANNTQGLLQDKHTVDTAAKKVRSQWLLGFSVAGLAIALGIYFGSTQITDIMVTRQLDRMAKATKLAKENTIERIRIAQENAEVMARQREQNRINMADAFNPVYYVEEEELTMLPEYADIYAQNPDVVGWLTIEGLDLDLPVLQRKSEPEYYLYRNINGDEDKNGSLFMDYRCDSINPTENTIIYGHNMKSGKMFGDLKKYLNKDFFNRNSTIYFNSLYEEKEFEIIAVCLAEVLDAGEDGFRYYDFTDAKNQADWDAFMKDINERSLYSMQVGLSPGDETLTLSTCNNYTEDGRLFLVAKRVK